MSEHRGREGFPGQIGIPLAPEHRDIEDRDEIVKKVLRHEVSLWRRHYTKASSAH